MRCPNRYIQKPPKSGNCVAKQNAKQKRCPNGTRKNKLGDCVPYNKRNIPMPARPEAVHWWNSPQTMSKIMIPIDFTELVLGKKYIIEVNENFFENEPNQPKVFLIGTLDTFECVSDEDAYFLYNELRDRIYTDNTPRPDSKAVSPRPIRDLYDPDLKCYGSFINVKQIYIEPPNKTIQIKDFETFNTSGERVILKGFIFWNDINKFKFYEITPNKKKNETKRSYDLYIL